MKPEVLADAGAVARAAVDLIREVAGHSLAMRGVFRLVLAGGSTPGRAYEMLADTVTDWNGWQFYLGDERCLPVDHPERNSVMLRQTLFDQVAVTEEQMHMIPAELGAEMGAAAYEKEVRPALPFDLVLLGLGEDGHTASLFPGHEHPEDRLAVPVHHAPKPPPDRISLNYGALCSAGTVLFLVSGAGKHHALDRWQRQGDIPAARIQGRERTLLLADEAAMHG